MGKNKKKPEELGCLGNGYCELQICGEEAANLVWREKRREEKRIELNFFASSSSSSSTAVSAHTPGNTDDVIAHRRFRTQNAAFVPDNPFFIHPTEEKGSLTKTTYFPNILFRTVLSFNRMLRSFVNILSFVQRKRNTPGRSDGRTTWFRSSVSTNRMLRSFVRSFVRSFAREQPFFDHPTEDKPSRTDGRTDRRRDSVVAFPRTKCCVRWYVSKLFFVHPMEEHHSRTNDAIP
jgi:hypothetical protein